MLVELHMLIVSQTNWLSCAVAASNEELVALGAVQQRQTLTMSKCWLCEYAPRVCCEWWRCSPTPQGWLHAAGAGHENVVYLRRPRNSAWLMVSGWRPECCTVACTPLYAVSSITAALLSVIGSQSICLHWNTVSTWDFTCVMPLMTDYWTTWLVLFVCLHGKWLTLFPHIPRWRD